MTIRTASRFCPVPGSLGASGGGVWGKPWPALWVAALLLLTSCGMFSKTVSPEEDARQTGNEALALKADIYDAMARLSRAQAEDDADAAEVALDEAMTSLQRLHEVSDGLQDAEGRELYRSVITAYEQYYGVDHALRLEHSDIYSYRDEMFAEMNAVAEPLDEEVALPELGPVQTTIPLQQNHLVEQSIQYLLRSPEKHLYNWISRSATYFPLFEQILQEEGVPDELKYLSMIESALVPRAVSHAGAAGLWQFMPATGKEYGLHRTTWIDERLDPEKSTRAAAKYLKKMHRQFGDWYLVLAAYNSGPGRVARAVKKHGQGASFWDIYDDLPRETRNYVPMFIATTTILTNPQAFDLNPGEPGPLYAYDVARVEGMLDLRVAADLAGVEAEMIRRLNPEIRQGTTPPTRGGYSLRVPEGSGQRFAQAYAALPEDQKHGQTEYVVRRGDNLTAIAQRHGTSVAALRDANGIRGSVIQPGQRLYVPAPYRGSTNFAASSGQADAGRNTPVRYASTTERAPAASSSGSRSRVTHKVRRGDTLSKIAQKYSVRISDVKGWNDLSGDRIRSGQRLTIYPGQAGSGSGASRVTYKVRRGDTLSKIAQKYGVRVSDVKTWNDLSGDSIRRGQRLTIYSSGGGASSSAGKKWTAYYVKKGDTLTKIAQRVGASVQDVRTWNSLKNDRLRVGQKLAVYSARL